MNIGRRFWLGVFVIVLLAVCFDAYTVVSSRQALVAAKEAELVGLAGALSDSIRHRIHEQVHFLEYLRLQRLAVLGSLSSANARGPEENVAKRSVLEREWLDGGRVVGDVSQSNVSLRLREFMAFIDEKHGYPVYAELFVTDVHGRVVGMAQKTSDFFQDDEEWWLDAMRFGVVADSFEFDESSGAFGLVVGIRLDDDAGRPLGVVKGVLNLGGLVQKVEADKLKVPAELLIVDGRGGLLFSSVSGFESFGRDLGGSELMQRAVGSEGFFELDGEVELPYVAYHELAGQGSGKWFSWVFVIRQGGGGLFAEVNKMVGFSVFFLLLLVCVVGLLGWFVSRRIVLPIEQLAEVLERTSTGLGNAEIPSVLKDARDEIGRLARSFDRMLYSLRMAVRKNPPKKDVD